MKRYPIILFVLFTICLTTTAQNSREPSTRKLSIESLELDVSDISGSIHLRLDANNSPCALIKIYLCDKIKYVEGQIVGEIIDKGSEKWIYVTEGTKKIKIIPSSYLPFEISTKDVSSINSFQGKKTYVLKLQGESFSNYNKAVKKASDKDPLIPKWVSNVNTSEWLGISAPCHSPERARTHAICNALTNYIVYNGRGKLLSKIKCRSSIIKEESYNTELLLTQEITLTGISFEISREYYNYRGEYFVLCAIVNDKRNDGNIIKLSRQISFTENYSSGDITDTWSVSFLLLFQMDEERGDILFSCNKNNMALDIDGKPIVSNQKLLYPYSSFKNSVAKRCLTIEDNIDMNMFSLGIMQSLLYAYVPFAPSIGKISLEGLKSSGVSDMNKFEHYSKMEYESKGNLLPFPLQFEFVEDKNLHFSVKENILDSAGIFHDNNISNYVRKEIKDTGLSEDYILLYDQIVKDSLGCLTHGYIEINANVPVMLGKNIAFWKCWEQWLSEISVNVINGEGNTTHIITELNKESAISDKEWKVKPFWFMDSNKRDFNHKGASSYNKHVTVAFVRNE
jgi:hypothetical protein